MNMHIFTDHRGSEWEAHFWLAGGGIVRTYGKTEQEAIAAAKTELGFALRQGKRVF